MRSALLLCAALDFVAVLTIAHFSAMSSTEKAMTDTSQPDNQASPFSGRDEGEKLKLVKNADGTKTLFIKWARSSRDDIVVLRIPWQYIPVIDRETEYPEPFITSFLFEAMLWDMQPNPRTRLPQEEAELGVDGYVRSVFGGTRKRTPAEQIIRYAEIVRTSALFSGWKRHGLNMIEKPEKYGLKRIGADHNLGLDTPNAIREYWYIGNNYDHPEQYMICTDLQIPDDIERRFAKSPRCQYEFPFDEYNTTIRVNFHRKHLPQWREIRTNVEGLVRSWVIEGGE